MYGLLIVCFAVEYTPQAYLQSDMQMFAQNYSEDLIGKEPYLVSIDGGKALFFGTRHMYNIHLFAGYVQTVDQGFSYNGESDLDLQYSMSLVTGKQTVTLYQTGDIPQGGLVLLYIISAT